MSGRIDDADQHRGAVTVGLDCVPTRRALDPTAWIVLEELVMTAGTVTNSTTVLAPTSVRELAGQLGLSKDTVASALRRLASAGIVRREDERDGGSGRFGRSRYVVDLISTGMGFVAPGDDSQPKPSDTVKAQPDRSRESAAGEGATRARRKHTRARRASDDMQLSLLDSDPNPT